MSSPSPPSRPHPTERRRSSASNIVPKSILRNAPAISPGASPAVDSQGTFDRQAVLENTRANAKLNNIGAEIKRRNTLESADELARELHNLNNNNGVNSTNSEVFDSGDEQKEKERQEHLKWDEANLYLTEQEKNATMKITEPKTPYQGAVGESEYYMPDEEDETVKTRDNRILSVDELDGFSLGEPITPPPIVEEERIVIENEVTVDNDGDDDEEEEEEEEEELSPEERHKRFEELRKSHYHMKGAVLHSPVPADDEEDDDEEDDEDTEEANK